MKKLRVLLLALAVTFGSAGCTRKTLSDIVNENNTTTGSDNGYHEYEVGDSVKTMFFNFTVEEFLSSTDISGNKPDAGKQFVAVKLKVENTFGQDIQMFSTDFLLEWDKTNADDKGVDGPHSYYDKDAIFDEEFEKEYTLTTGESKEGVLVFEVPEGVTEVSLTVQDIYNDKQGNQHEGDVYIVHIDLSAQ